MVAAARALAVTAQQQRVWLVAEVGVGGGGIYPEDDLAEEAGVTLPVRHVLHWDDNAEMATLVRELEDIPTAVALNNALASFVGLADTVERHLTSVEELDVEPAPRDDVRIRGLDLLPPPL